MKTSAIIDRFEEGFAVILLKEGDAKLVLERKKLPKKAKEGHWLLIDFEGEFTEENIVDISIDEDETRNARIRIREKLEKLRRGDHLEEE
jgi:hypothetical protein